MIRFFLTSVPVLLPRSWSHQTRSRTTSCAWREETSLLRRITSQSVERPKVSRSPETSTLSPWYSPPLITIAAIFLQMFAADRKQGYLAIVEFSCDKCLSCAVPAGPVAVSGSCTRGVRTSRTSFFCLSLVFWLKKRLTKGISPSNGVLVLKRFPSTWTRPDKKTLSPILHRTVVEVCDFSWENPPGPEASGEL